LRGRSLHALGGDLVAFVDIRCNRWKNASLCDTAAMVCYALLRPVLAHGGVNDATQTRLLRALPGMPSSQPPLRLWTLSRTIAGEPELRALFERVPPEAVLPTLKSDPRFASFHIELQRFLSEWGFRSSGELMLTTPTLEEQPEPVVALLQQYVLATGESPQDSMVRMADERRRETRSVVRTLLRRRPLLVLPTIVLLRWTQRAVVSRERARLKQALLYTRCRRLAVAIGDELVRSGRLCTRDDIFMLSWQEIEEVCAGRALLPRELTSLVRLRRQAHASESTQTPPDTFSLPLSGFFSGSVTSEQRSQIDTSALLATRAKATLRGTTACGGRVSAPAAVLSGVDQAQLLKHGDVLVTRQTDPGWAPVFCLVSGLVIERGGMLSHGAIIAREFGLPCIVGVTSATTRIRHGSNVDIDADAGVCHVEAAS
jgi:pyruvate,water dikinase